jgi:hypothetical protein
LDSSSVDQQRKKGNPDLFDPNLKFSILNPNVANVEGAVGVRPQPCGIIEVPNGYIIREIHI